MTDLTTGPLSAEQQNLQPMEKRNPWTRGAQKPPGDLSFCERFRALVGAPFVSDKLRTELRWLFSFDLRGGYCPPTYALLLLGHHCRPLHRHTCLQACTGKIGNTVGNTRGRFNRQFNTNKNVLEMVSKNKYGPRGLLMTIRTYLDRSRVRLNLQNKS